MINKGFTGIGNYCGMLLLLYSRHHLFTLKWQCTMSMVTQQRTHTSLFISLFHLSFLIDFMFVYVTSAFLTQAYMKFIRGTSASSQSVIFSQTHCLRHTLEIPFVLFSKYFIKKLPHMYSNINILMVCLLISMAHENYCTYHFWSTLTSSFQVKT